MAPNKPFSSLKHCVIKPLPKHQCPGCSHKVFTTAGLTKHIQYHHPGLLDDQDNIHSDPHIPNDEDLPPSSSPDVALSASPPVASPTPDIGMSASHPVGSLSQAHNNAPSPASLHPSSPAPPSLFHHERPHSPPSFLPHMDIDDVIDFFPRSTSPPNQSPSGCSDSPESPIPSHRGDSPHGNAQSPTAEDAPLPSYSQTYHHKLNGMYLFFVPTNLLDFKPQVTSAIYMATISHPTALLLLLLQAPSAAPTTGSPMKIEYNSSLPTFFTIVIKCQRVTWTSYLIL